MSPTSFFHRRPAAGTAAAIPLPPSDATTTVTTSFLLANLHCPTCVSTIKSALHAACGGVKWVSPNVVTSVVTVEHARDASVRRMRDALEESGFEVCAVSTSAGDASDLDSVLEQPADEGEYNGESSTTPNHTNNTATTQEATAMAASTFSRWFRPSTTTQHSPQARAAHLQNCEQCRTGAAPSTPAQPIADDKTIEKTILETVLTHPSTTTPDTTTPTTPTGTNPQFTTPQISTITQDATTEPFIAISTDEDIPAPRYRATLAIGGMTCSACSNMLTAGLSKHPWLLNPVVTLLTNSATVDLFDPARAGDVVSAVEELGYDATLDSVVEIKVDVAGVKKQPQGEVWRAELAVGGMTCASCANGITRELSKKDWVRNVSVNLLTNSATIDFTGQDNADLLVEGITDLGYDATLSSVSPLVPEGGGQETHERTVEIRIDGMYCPHCPERVVTSLGGFREQLAVLTPPTRARPIVKITYRPDAPNFTLRRILSAIAASDPAFSATVYHPPTLEQRSKEIQRKHQLQILWRVVFTAIAAVPSFVLGVVYMSLVSDHVPSKHYLMQPWTSGISRAQVALFVLATPVYFFAADLFHRRAIKEIRTLWRRGSRVPVWQRFYRFGSMNMLMSLGTTVAYISSVSQMIAAAVEGAEEVNDSNFYFDSVVFLTGFLLVGRLIESYSKARTGDAVEMLGKLRPTTAVLVEGYGTEKEGDVEVKADTLDFGEVVRVAHGASPPADGVVVRGESSFDESSLTGESRLVKKTAGDEVFSGTVNKAAAVLVRITGVPGTSLLDQIVHIVREGQTKRAPIEQVADLMTSYFVPVVTLMAVLTWIIWLSLGLSGHIPAHYLDVTSGGWVAFSLQFAISVFVVACPCGLALAAPTAIFVGSGLAAKHGILAKGGGEAFEKASRIDCVVFDKTGTLTMGGEPKITDSEVYAADDEEKHAVLAALKAVEENSTHPIAKAIVSFCAAALPEGTKPTTNNLQELPGKGMQATIHNSTTNTTFHLAVGNESLMTDLSVPIPPTTATLLTTWKSQAKSIALIATTPNPTTHPWSLTLALSISDPLRPEAAPIIHALQSHGTRVYMLSGDNPTTAAAVAASLGIPPDQVMAGVLPAGKAEKIKELQTTLRSGDGSKKRGMVAMVGDGINDAPALATADVGVAIGSGADVAISSADFVLVKSDLAAVVGLVELSRVVLRRIKFNFGWAVVYNCVALPVAAGAFYPLVTGSGAHVRLDPVWASLAMALSSISVVLSSLALRVRVKGVGYRERRIEGVERDGREE